jgi:hypothetical protein
MRGNVGVWGEGAQGALQGKDLQGASQEGLLVDKGRIAAVTRERAVPRWPLGSRVVPPIQEELGNRLER